MSDFENAKVRVKQGWLQGYTEGALKIFKGIPYARAKRFHIVALGRDFQLSALHKEKFKSVVPNL